MIAIEEKGDLLEVSVLGELALPDYRKLEQAVRRELKQLPKVKLLLDVRGMTGFTLDVAWEEIKFTRSHAHDFRRIAVVTPDQWAPWLSWVSAAFTDAEVMLFEDPRAAEAWLQERK
ncbi:hypothetical protein SVA_3742 [Sulfurifustis variabilis]|uniref:STAS/SEC14 domain-containing protein n=1 Tax=Sulfurifustis variabilis TaxID=1675686 RepID=A0A1C7AFU5_9GAMM|nr:STAS/SEC14 domain-containing protein [Sulfurifustis variabilis]BAU50276.1 hypothetical protein SVA_3742 [Sulfurifustis variabilis]